MNLKNVFDGKGNQHKIDSEKIGDLEKLSTNAKDCVVSAVNEVDGRVPKAAPEGNEGFFLRVVDGALSLQELTDVSQKTELTDYVIMPGECYQALCDLVREKTGEIDSLTIRRLLEKVKPLFDVSGVTATRYDVLEGTKYVDSEGHLTYGSMENQGAVRVIMKPERSLAGISNGYHNGLGTILVNEGTETFTPTKEEQTYIAEGFYPKEIHIEPIPDQYKDVTNVTATANDVLTGKVIVNASGNEVEGRIKQNEAISKSLTTRETMVTIPKGYYDEDSNVYVSYITHRDAIPDKSTQTITGYSSFLKEVTVKPIPDKYQDVTPVTATAADVLEGKTIVDASGNEVMGGMTDNGAFSTNLSMSGGKTGFNIPKGYHNGEGVIKVLSRTKTVTPSKTKQVVSDWDHQTQWYLESVTVNPIPDEYQDVTPVTATAEDVRAGKVFVDAEGKTVEGALSGIGADVSGVTATAADVLEGKTIVDADGNVVEGAMKNRGKVTMMLSPDHGSYSKGAGYYSDITAYALTTERVDVTPTKDEQTVSAPRNSSGHRDRFLSSVTVKPIPDQYQDVTPVTATAEDVRAGKVFVDAQGNPTEGTALIQTGMHLSIEDMVAPSEFYQIWFRLNDTLYAAVGLVSSWEIYKYDDNSWVKVVDEMEVLLEHPSSSTYAIEYNGVIHFFARNKQNHYVFDGITLSQKSDLPDRTRSVCLYQGKIVNYMEDNCIYQWDEVTDTWTLFIENIPTSNYFTHIFTANGFLYVQDDTILYKFTNNEKEEVGNIPTTAIQLFVKDNTVVTLNRGQYYNSPNRVYVYDLVTGTSVFLGNFPTNAEFMYICEDGSIRGLFSDNSPSGYVSSFILEIRGTVATTN